MAPRARDNVLINPEYFQGSFSVDAFLVSLTKDVIDPAPSSQSRGNPEHAAKDPLDKVHKILKVLDRAESEVSELRHDVISNVTKLQQAVKEDEGNFKNQVRALERGSERIKDGVRDIDSRVSNLSQTATRIGDRLQRADGMRARALEAQELISYLHAFSTLTSQDYSLLPPLFTKEATLKEAAAVSRRLTLLVGEVAAAKQRTKMVTRAGMDNPYAATPGNTGGHGSVEHTVTALERYCNWLENRVVSRFDQAVAESNLGVQAECAHIMAQFDREKTIAQRWVASRSMFLDISDDVMDDWLLRPCMTESDTSVAQAQVRALGAMYKEMHAAVKFEVAAAQQIFPDPNMVLDLFLQRLFEQKVQAALERLLSQANSLIISLSTTSGTSLPPTLLPKSTSFAAQTAAAATASTISQGAEQQRARLVLLESAYKKTCKLASNLEKAVKGVQIDVGAMADGLWPTFLGTYPQQELAWLETGYREETAKLDSPELSFRLAQQLMAWSSEATHRAVGLAGPGLGPRYARLLFHHVESGQSGAHPGCLLEQLARHIIGGVEFSLELCRVSGGAGVASIFRMGFGAVTRTTSTQMAEAFVTDKIRRVLEAAHVSGLIVGALQAHFTSVVLPVVCASPSEHGASSSALLSLIRAVENSVTMVLRKCVDAFMVQMERVLYSEQRRSDFTPKDDDLSFDRATGACMMGTALLQALGAAARATLEGPNLAPMLAEVARRTHLALLAHMTRYVYSPTGALKWKKDVTEYCEVLREFGIPAVNESMNQLQQLVNVLIVAPESLLGLVNGSLRMSHKEALRYIALREDFKTAKVEGKTLQQLFSGEEGGWGTSASSTAAKK